jgi:hypothetical protein
MMYFAPHCPHTPAMPADWYNESCAGVTAPKADVIPNYNWTHPSFHELVAKQPPLTAADEIMIDDLVGDTLFLIYSILLQPINSSNPSVPLARKRHAWKSTCVAMAALCFLATPIGC